jgi:hypothetical protein
MEETESGRRDRVANHTWPPKFRGRWGAARAEWWSIAGSAGSNIDADAKDPIGVAWNQVARDMACLEGLVEHPPTAAFVDPAQASGVTLLREAISHVATSIGQFRRQVAEATQRTVTLQLSRVASRALTDLQRQSGALQRFESIYLRALNAGLLTDAEPLGRISQAGMGPGPSDTPVEEPPPAGAEAFDVVGDGSRSADPSMSIYETEWDLRGTCSVLRELAHRLAFEHFGGLDQVPMRHVERGWQRMQALPALYGPDKYTVVTNDGPDENEVLVRIRSCLDEIEADIPVAEAWLRVAQDWLADIDRQMTPAVRDGTQPMSERHASDFGSHTYFNPLLRRLRLGLFTLHDFISRAQAVTSLPLPEVAAQAPMDISRVIADFYEAANRVAAAVAEAAAEIARAGYLTAKPPPELQHVVRMTMAQLAVAENSARQLPRLLIPTDRVTRARARTIAYHFQVMAKELSNAVVTAQDYGDAARAARARLGDVDDQAPDEGTDGEENSSLAELNALDLLDGFVATINTRVWDLVEESLTVVEKFGTFGAIMEQSVVLNPRERVG